MEIVLKENHAEIEKVMDLSSKFGHTVVIMNMKLLASVTRLFIYHNLPVVQNSFLILKKIIYIDCNSYMPCPIKYWYNNISLDIYILQN